MNAHDHNKNNAPSNEPTTTSCNKKTQVYSRVVGYIRPIDHWNEAKKEEFENRKEYSTD